MWLKGPLDRVVLQTHASPGEFFAWIYDKFSVRTELAALVSECVLHVAPLPSRVCPGTVVRKATAGELCRTPNGCSQIPAPLMPLGRRVAISLIQLGQHMPSHRPRLLDIASCRVKCVSETLSHRSRTRIVRSTYAKPSAAFEVWEGLQEDATWTFAHLRWGVDECTELHLRIKRTKRPKYGRAVIVGDFSPWPQHLATHSRDKPSKASATGTHASVKGSVGRTQAATVASKQRLCS